jgi:hypothetical protein
MYIKDYKDYAIQKTKTGVYRTYLKNEQRITTAYTLKDIKRLIDKDRKRM